jgi:hypothetical protein
MSMDFDGDGLSERIGLNVEAVVILASERSQANHLVAHERRFETMASNDAR